MIHTLVLVGSCFSLLLAHVQPAYATATELTVLDLLVEPRRVEQGAAALESPMRKQTTVVLDANNNVTSPAGALLSLPSYDP